MKLTKNAWIGTLIAKKILLLGDLVPQTPYQVSVFRKITVLIISIIKRGFYVNVGMLTKGIQLFIWNVCSKYAPKRFSIRLYFINQKKLQFLGPQFYTVAKCKNSITSNNS